jgi:glutaminase
MEPNGINNSIFRLISNDKDTISTSELKSFFLKNGFLPDDPRWSKSFEIFDYKDKIDEETFNQTLKESSLELVKMSSDDLIIPEFSDFREEIRNIFEETKKNTEGKVADYIPQLSRVDPDKFGLSLCTIDGQRFNLGDYAEEFSLQSCSKPIVYSIALEALGEDLVHKYVDKEPSGQAFNAMTLTPENLPYNPMVNAGSIMVCSLIDKELCPSERFDKVIQWTRRLAGGIRPGFNNSVYLSEKLTADRNFAMAYLMKSKGGFPEGTNIVDTLEFYFQCCSIEMNCKSLAIVASTLANGGVCPITRERVLSTNTTRSVLSLMFSCGMYDYSGQFAFSIGLPAKSGVSGAIMVVIPGLMGFCIWSPRLDEHGNSKRGLEFCQRLVNKFNFHNFDNLINCDNFTKIDPRKTKKSTKQQISTEFFYACFENNLNTVKRMIIGGVDINMTDYDRRTALHISASEGLYDICKYLLEKGADTSIRDRWNNTPYDDAVKMKHIKVANLIKGSKGKE